MRRVILVAGPPCSGKTTYVADRAHPGDLVLDQDDVGPARYRQMLAQVTTMQDGTAWVIRCAPGPRARAQLAEQVGADDVVLMVPPRTELKARAAQRRDPARARAAIGAWFRHEAADRPPSTSREATGKGSTSARGYGTRHQAERARWRPVVKAGNAVCWRCGEGVDPDEPWDLGHDDGDRRHYRGPEHRACNRSAGARTANARRSAQPAPILHSQRW